MSIIHYTPEEQATHRRLWADRLAKMDLPQVFGSLRTDCGYCVLGVGCEVFYAGTGLGHWEAIAISWYEYSEDSRFSFVVPGDDELVEASSSVCLPDQVVEFYGLNFEDGSFCFDPHDSISDEDDEPPALVTRNDVQKLPFDMLADIIRNEPKGLFQQK